MDRHCRLDRHKSGGSSYIRSIWGRYDKWRQELEIHEPIGAFSKLVRVVKNPMLHRKIQLLLLPLADADRLGRQAVFLDKVFFTDGSMLGNTGRAGAAFVLSVYGDVVLAKGFPMTFFCTIFEVELFAIYQAILEAVARRFPFITIFSDCQSALWAICANQTPHTMVKDIWSLVQSHDIQIALAWVPAHKGILLNEFADSEAFSAAKRAERPGMILSTNYLINELELARMEKDLHRIRSGRVCPFLCSKRSLMLVRKHFPGNHILFQVLTNVSNLRSSVSNVSVGVSPFCQFCRRTAGSSLYEDLAHVVLHCPQFSSLREAFFRFIGYRGNLVPTTLLRYVFVDRLRLLHFVSYLHSTQLFQAHRFYSLLNG